MLIPIDTIVINNDSNETYEEKKKILERAIRKLEEIITDSKYELANDPVKRDAIVKNINTLKKDLEELEQESKNK